MIDALIYTALTPSDLNYTNAHASGLTYQNNPDLTWRVYPRGSLGIDDIPAKPDYPYVMYAESSAAANRSVRDTTKSLTSYYDIYVYDAPGSFQRIKQILAILCDTVVGLKGQTTADGVRCTDVVFTGFGQDAYDPITKQNSKVASFQVVYSR